MVVDWPCAMTAGWALIVTAAGPVVGVGVGLGLGLGPGLPPPTPAQPVKANNARLRRNMNSTRNNSGLGMASQLPGTCREMKKQQLRLASFCVAGLQTAEQYGTWLMSPCSCSTRFGAQGLVFCRYAPNRRSFSALVISMAGICTAGGRVKFHDIPYKALS
jgi:hypothetical protein